MDNVTKAAVVVYFILCGSVGKEPTVTFPTIERAMEVAARTAHEDCTWCEVWSRDEGGGAETMVQYQEEEPMCMMHITSDGDVLDRGTAMFRDAVSKAPRAIRFARGCNEPF